MLRVPVESFGQMIMPSLAPTAFILCLHQNAIQTSSYLEIITQTVHPCLALYIGSLLDSSQLLQFTLTKYRNFTNQNGTNAYEEAQVNRVHNISRHAVIPSTSSKGSYEGIEYSEDSNEQNSNQKSKTRYHCSAETSID